jgi:hypothetical protein
MVLALLITTLALEKWKEKPQLDSYNGTGRLAILY